MYLKRKLLSAATLSIFLAGISNVLAGSESTVQEITRLEHESYAAIIAKDYDNMRLLIADDWVQQDDSDDKITRELMIERLKAGIFIPESGTFGPMSVDELGDVALVMGTVEERFSFAGKPFALHSNFLDVWMKRKGKWMSIRTQMASRDSTKTVAP